MYMYDEWYCILIQYIQIDSLDLYQKCSDGYCQGKLKCTSACSVAAIMTVTNMKMEKRYWWCICIEIDVAFLFNIFNLID